MLDLGVDLPEVALDELHGLDLDAALQLLTDRIDDARCAGRDICSYDWGQTSGTSP